MTVLVDPDAAFAHYEPMVLKRSPDGQKVLIVTKTGNLNTGANDYRMVVYSIADVRRTLSGGVWPGPTTVASFSSTSNREGISHAKWLADSSTIAFIGEMPGAPAQVYTVNVATRIVRRLTSSPSPVIDFDVSLETKNVLYQAEIAPDWSWRNAHGYVVGTENIYDMMGRGERGLYPSAAFFIFHPSGSAVRVHLPSYVFYGEFAKIWLSPNGRWAIVLQHINGPSRWWIDYGPIRRDKFSGSGEESYWSAMSESGIADFAANTPNVFFQYALVDLQTADARPIVDAPTGLGFAGGGLWAHWQSDNSSVILANTFLPLGGADDSEIRRRRASPSIVEVDIRTGRVQRIVDLIGSDTDKGGTRESFSGASLKNDGTLLVDWLVNWQSAKDGTREAAFRKVAGQWTELVTRPAHRSDSPETDLTLGIEQGLNAAPEIVASDVVNGRRSIISDFNPRFRSLTMGRIEVIRWCDTTGREWTGGLLKPTDWVPGHRYPLVIQTHGFNEDSFLIDGPDGSASGFAARALANRSIAVLQVDDSSPAEPFGQPVEIDARMQAYESAIATLDAQGLIDPRRVGMHGWSRTGYYLQRALVFSDMKLAAASVTNSGGLGLFSYVVWFGGPYPAMLETERMLGMQLWGAKSAEHWIERDPTFHLDNVHTPLLIQDSAYGLDWLDTYAILRRHQRPVEFMFFPDGAHMLIKPWERLASQESVVDWFDFWLRGHEDPDSAKTEQYRRWEKLCDMQAAQNPSVTTSCLRTKAH